VGEVARAGPTGACLVRGCLTSLVILLLLLDGSSGVFLGVCVFFGVVKSKHSDICAISWRFGYSQFYARCCFRSTARALGVCQGQCVALCSFLCVLAVQLLGIS
jgi:hypothetical protein